MSDARGRSALGPSAFEIDQQRTQFQLGIFVGLGDGESEGFVQPPLGFGAAAEGDESFAELDAGHHPIGLLLRAGFEVRQGVRGPTFVGEGLGEAETEKFVVRLALDQRGKVTAPTFDRRWRRGRGSFARGGVRRHR